MSTEVVTGVLRDMYGRAAAAAASGGSELTWSIENVRTIFREEFKDHQYDHLVSRDQDYRLSFSSINIHLPENVVRRKWHVEWRPYDGILEGEEMNLAQVADNLEELAGPEAARIVALSAYDVSLSFQSRQVHYRAAMLWKEDKEQREGHMQASFVEPVIPLIATIDDAVPLLTEEEIKGHPLEEILRRPMMRTEAEVESPEQKER